MYTSRCTIYSSADGLDVKECSSWEVEECSIGPPNRLSAATKGQLETRRFRVPAHVAGAGRAVDGWTFFSTRKGNSRKGAKARRTDAGEGRTRHLGNGKGVFLGFMVDFGNVVGRPQKELGDWGGRKWFIGQGLWLD